MSEPSLVTVVGGPHDGKRIHLTPGRMVLRTSSGVYMRTAALPDHLFHLLPKADPMTERPRFRPDDIDQIISDRLDGEGGPTMNTTGQTVSMDEDEDRG